MGTRSTKCPQPVALQLLDELQSSCGDDRDDDDDDDRDRDGASKDVS